MSPFLEEQIPVVVEDSRWTSRIWGCRSSSSRWPWRRSGACCGGRTEPLLRKLLRYVMGDEARHVAFGMMTLREFYTALGAAELRDRQEFLPKHAAGAGSGDDARGVGTDGRPS